MQGKLTHIPWRPEGWRIGGRRAQPGHCVEGKKKKLEILPLKFGKHWARPQSKKAALESIQGIFLGLGLL